MPTYAIGGFSGGPRTCIGKHFAKLSNKIGLIKFLKRYSNIALSVDKLEYVMKFSYAPKDFKTNLVKA